MNDDENLNLKLLFDPSTEPEEDRIDDKINTTLQQPTKRTLAYGDLDDEYPDTQLSTRERQIHGSLENSNEDAQLDQEDLTEAEGSSDWTSETGSSGISHKNKSEVLGAHPTKSTIRWSAAWDQTLEHFLDFENVFGSARLGSIVDREISWEDSVLGCLHGYLCGTMVQISLSGYDLEEIVNSMSDVVDVGQSLPSSIHGQVRMTYTAGNTESSLDENPVPEVSDAELETGKISQKGDGQTTKKSEYSTAYSVMS